MNFPAFHPHLPSAIALLLLVAACRRDEAEPLVPPAPPRLAVAELRAVGGPVADPDADCVELGQDQAGTVVVALADAGPTSLGDWILRGPGACKGVDACGFLRATAAVAGLSREVEVLSTTSTLSLPLAQLFASAVGADEGGTVTTTATISLLGTDGFAVREATGERVELSFEMVLASPGGCAETELPDEPAEPGGGGAAGAGGLGGAGGAPTDSATAGGGSGPELGSGGAAGDDDGGAAGTAGQGGADGSLAGSGGEGAARGPGGAGGGAGTN